MGHKVDMLNRWDLYESYNMGMCGRKLNIGYVWIIYYGGYVVDN